MACRLTEICVNSTDPARLAAWWAEVLGYDVVDSDADGNRTIGPPGAPPKGPAPAITFVRVPDPTPGRRRLHLDVNATDRPQAEELERLLALGARRADVGQTGEESWVVLADPEGNEFCLLASTVAPL
jgi:catechol 2,3-dioxygenase-like lactoylglutathione lyase family enzyme